VAINQTGWASPGERKPSNPNGSPTILVVDDEQHLLKLYEKELSEEGYLVRTATDGEEALRMAQSESPDLVILDIKLQDRDGLEVLGELRKIRQEVPIILNSAYSTYKSDFQSWLADAYLVKSPNLDKLKEKIRTLLDLKKSG
jgi:two-component system response regulator (stage 0 sporulation protein F)